MFTVGEYVEYTMVTDTQVYEVIGVTDHTIRVRSTRDGERVHVERDPYGCPWPIVWTAALSDPFGYVKTVRLRKDGTYRMYNGAGKLRPATVVEGVPARRTDYSF